MNESAFQILNSLPLVEVMRGWGYVPKREGDQSASYLCPWHDDHRPSLVVDKQVRKGATDLGFKCFACGQEGYGAVQLAARLMGFAAGPVPREDLGQVMDEMASRCDVELPQPEDGKRRRSDTLRVSVVGWSEFFEQEPQYSRDDIDEGRPIFERGEWTEEGLKALGLKVELATRRARKADVIEYRNKAIEVRADLQSDRSEYKDLQSDKDDKRITNADTQGSRIANPSERNTTTAEIKVGDALTQFDADTGLPLYRCSLGKDYYRGPQKAETRTIAEWGRVLEETFGVEPVSRFLQKKQTEKGGVIVRIVRATRNYPMFMFRYPWAVKKYEPRDVYGNKWTWWQVAEDADLYHQWYADKALEAMLTPGTVMPPEDARHPMREVVDETKKGKAKGDDDEDRPKKRVFERIVLCSGPRDAIAVWSHSNAHVIWLNSESAGFDHRGGNTRPNRWLRALIKKLLGVVAEGGLYVCYDEDTTGLASSQAIALNSPQVRWLRLPKELTEIACGKERYCKDVTDFIQRFTEVEARMPAEVQHDDPVEWFDNALFDTPTCQFWQWESERKDADGSTRARYKFDLRNTPVFLRARGMVRQNVQQGKEQFSRFFLLGNDQTYQECFSGEKGANKLVSLARDLMAEWLRAHSEFNDKKGALSRAIYSAKLEQSALDSIEQMAFDEKSFGETFDYFFFENTAVRVTASEVKKVPYSQMTHWTNREAILEGDFTPLPQLWHVTVSPYYESERLKHEATLQEAHTTEEVQQENMRWDAWASLWHYQLVLDRPLEEMPLHFRFLANACRIFWEREAAGQELTKTERQMQDMYLISMLHALGSALVRQRSANRQQFIHITDNGTRREDLASGGTGKTAILELLSLVRRVLRIDGKALGDGNIKLSQETEKVVPGLHNIVALDELPPNFNPQTLYNHTLSLTSRGLYRGSVKLEGNDLPKFVVASNEQLDLSSDSTNRRIYQVLVGDWYHPRPIDGSRPAHTPADDFRREGLKEIARNLPPALLNEARNLLIGCTQLFLQLPEETIRPPRDSRALLRQALAASKDEQFTRWIASYLADRRHLGQPIAKRELAISLLDFCGITVGEKTIKGAMKRIRDNLDDYLRASIYVANPPVTWLTPTDRERKFRQCAAWQHQYNADGTLALDKDGNRLPRVLNKSNQPLCYYFYRKGHIPKHFYEPGHEGDKDYVQAASESDPERE